MTDYPFHKVAVYDQLGGVVRLARNSRIDVTDPTTGLVAAGLKVAGVSVSFVTTDSRGTADFTSTLGTVDITSPNGLTERISSHVAIEAAVGAGISSDAAIAAAIANPASATRGAGDVVYGKKFQINVADYATPQLAMAALTDGATIYFPAGTYALAGTPLQPTAGVDNVTVLAAGARFTLTTWGKPAFDLLDVHGWTGDYGTVEYTGTRGNHTGTFRGGATYTHGCGVYTNGDRHHIRSLRTIGMPTPVYFSSWDGASISGRTGVGNHIGRLECEGYDFGVLWTAQRDLVIDDLYAHDDTDDSGGVNPTHAYYGSGVSTARSTGITIKKARCENNDGGQAFQLKYADQANLTNHSADACKGVMNFLDCDNLTWDGMTSVNTLAPASGGAISSGFTTATNKSPKLSNTTVAFAANQDAPAVTIWGDDAQVNSLTVIANRSSGGNIADNDVILRGANGRVRGLTMRSRGALHARGATLGYSGTTVTGWVVEDVVAEATRSAVDLLGGGSGNTVRYDPASVVLTGSGAAVTVTGTATGNEVSIVTPVQSALSTFGDHGVAGAFAGGSNVVVPVANNGIQCLVTPRRDVVVTNLMWFSVTASGNYDIAIVDDALSTRLWSKGSTAWPAAGTITETVTGVTMRAGRTYRLVFSADNATGALRGTTAGTADALTRMDGLFAAYLTSGLFPVGATPARGSTGSIRVPLLIVKGT